MTVLEVTKATHQQPSLDKDDGNNYHNILVSKGSSRAVAGGGGVMDSDNNNNRVYDERDRDRSRSRDDDNGFTYETLHQSVIFAAKNCRAGDEPLQDWQTANSFAAHSGAEGSEPHMTSCN